MAGIEDSSGQEMKKKHAVGRVIEDAEGMRSRADLNRDRWIQSPECKPLHHGTS